MPMYFDLEGNHLEGFDPYYSRYFSNDLYPNGFHNSWGSGPDPLGVGAALVELSDNFVRYYHYRLHMINYPINGNPPGKYWIRELHRLDGPAVESYDSKIKLWYINDKLRVDVENFVKENNIKIPMSEEEKALLILMFGI